MTRAHSPLSLPALSWEELRFLVRVCLFRPVWVVHSFSRRSVSCSSLTRCVNDFLLSSLLAELHAVRCTHTRMITTIPTLSSATLLISLSPPRTPLPTFEPFHELYIPLISLLRSLLRSRITIVTLSDHLRTLKPFSSCHPPKDSQ